MAERPVFIPDSNAPGLLRQRSFRIASPVSSGSWQKQHDIQALHAAAAAVGLHPLLEISTKSDHQLGQRLSALNLVVRSAQFGDMPLECAYQGSKLFERGGPYTDLYRTDPWTVKRDPRLTASGRITGFRLGGCSFPTQPKTAFYDWLYLNCLIGEAEPLSSEFEHYSGFTDIEFKPARSVNCQARSCALFVSLQHLGLLQAAIRSPAHFLAFMQQHAAP